MSNSAEKKQIARTRGAESQHLGTLVESEFAYRCTQAGFTVNKSGEDTQGWDFFLQLPSPNDPRALLDLAPPQLSCLVQVKGTTDADGSIRMNLANALRLAKSPIPTFIVIAHASDKGILRWWLLHCDNRFIEKTLRRVADVGHQEEPTTLNRIWLTLSGLEGIDLPVEGSALRETIARHVGSNSYDYVRQKNQWLNTVGYAQGRKSVSLSLSDVMSSEYFARMARFAVGLEKQLPIDSVDVYDLRFGQMRHERSYKDVVIELPDVPTGPAVRLELTSHESESIMFDGDTYVASAVFPFLPPEHVIIRIRTEHFDIHTERDPGNPELVTVHWKFRSMDEQLSETQLARLNNAAKAMRWLSSGTAKLKVWSGGESHELQYAAPVEPNSDVMDYFESIENYGIVTQFFGVQLGDQIVTHEQVMAQRQCLKILAAAATGRNAQAGAKFPPGQSPPGFDCGTRCALLFAPWIRTSQSLLVVVTAMVGMVTDVEAQPGARQLTCDRLMPLSKRLCAVGTKLDMDSIYNEAEAFLVNIGITNVYRPSKDEGD